MDMRCVKPPRRLTRETWLARALDALSAEGEGQLRIDRLVELLGVSKGSFYWHFRDRADFVRSVAAYWAESMTKSVVEEVGATDADPRKRLRQVAEMVTRRGYGRHDIAMRAWASHEPDVATMVKRVDRDRIEFVGGLFAELGFRGEELAMRTRMFVTFFSFEHGLVPRESRAARLRKLKRRVDFFTRP